VRQFLWMAAAAWLLAWATEAFAAEPGNVAAGHRLALRWCSECHQVEMAKGFASEDEAQSFAKINLPTDP